MELIPRLLLESESEMFSVAFALAIALLCLGVEYCCLRRDFNSVVRSFDTVVECSRRITEQRDEAVEMANAITDESMEVYQTYAAYDSPFQKPFTSPRSGMGIAKS